MPHAHMQVSSYYLYRDASEQSNEKAEIPIRYFYTGISNTPRHTVELHSPKTKPHVKYKDDQVLLLSSRNTFSSAS
jgi:hypothetical protein